MPVPGLTEEQRRIWLETVNSKPAEWFGREQIPLIESYCRHAAYAATLAREIDKWQEEWLADDEALRRHRVLLEMHDRQVKGMSLLATRLRLTNQSVTDTETFGVKARRKATPKVWQRAVNGD